jgi:hypothetical protein
MKNERKPGLGEFPDGDGCSNGGGSGGIGGGSSDCSTETIVSTGHMRPTSEKIPRV